MQRFSLNCCIKKNSSHAPPPTPPPKSDTGVFVIFVQFFVKSALKAIQPQDFMDFFLFKHFV